MNVTTHVLDGIAQSAEFEKRCAAFQDVRWGAPGQPSKPVIMSIAWASTTASKSWVPMANELNANNNTSREGNQPNYGALWSNRRMMKRGRP